jgi:hypothetical protein
MKFSALLALTIALVIASLALGSSKSKSKSHKKEKSSLRSTKNAKSKTKQQLSEKEETEPIEPIIPEAEPAKAWIAAISYGTDSTCVKREPLPPSEGSWAYKSFPLGGCVPSSSGEVKASFKYEYVSDSQFRHTTYTDATCAALEKTELLNIGGCAALTSGSKYYNSFFYRTHAAGDYYAPMMWTYHASENDCNTAAGNVVDITGSTHGFATYSYPDPDCWANYPLAGNISQVKTFGRFLKYCSGYTQDDCLTARTETDNVPHCHSVTSCSAVNNNEEYGDYWLSFDTFKATSDDDIGDTPMIGQMVEVNKVKELNKAKKQNSWW